MLWCAALRRFLVPPCFGRQWILQLLWPGLQVQIVVSHMLHDTMHWLPHSICGIAYGRGHGTGHLYTDMRCAHLAIAPSLELHGMAAYISHVLLSASIKQDVNSMWGRLPPFP